DNYLADFSVPEGFCVAEELTLLADGESAPVWEGYTTNGMHFTSDSLKGHYVLLFLTDINCPGNQLSIQLVSNLYNKYSEGKLKVIGIYSDKWNSLEKYRLSNNIPFPLIYDGQAIKNAFHAPGAPYFYILDPQGKVAFSRMGYSDDLEAL